MFTTISFEEVQPIIELFEKDSGEEMEARIDRGRLFVQGEESELLLRFNPLLKKLVIARIEFKHKRQGYGTAFLEVLKEYAKNNDYSCIELESIMTKEASYFALKHGFKQKGIHGLDKDSEFYFMNNYELNIQNK